MNQFFHPRLLLSTLLSFGVSLLIVSMLIQAFSGTNAEFLPRLVKTLSATSLGYVALYVVASFIQAIFRTFRFRLILATGAEKLPGFGHLFIVTMARSMFVDLLPARLGELSFIAMLNRGYRVGADLCISALSISFLFDMISLGLLLCTLILYQLFVGSYEPWLLGAIGVVFVLSLGLIIALFPLADRIAGFLRQKKAAEWKYLGKLVQLFNDTAAALQEAARGGILIPVVLLSLGVRISKYLGLYTLFLAVVLPSFPGVHTDLGAVLVSLVSGEASASLPIPAFMSFGSYEAGGALALIALGVNKTGALLIMLALHMWSQAIDYSLGIGAVVIFFFVVSQRREKSEASTRVSKPAWLMTAAVVFFGLLFFAYQLRGIKKLGGFTPPAPGQAVGVVAADPFQRELDSLHGFVVWSSNRFGNHDILKMTLPDRIITRLTTHPHSEYYPRISPDGESVVFARGHEIYVSHRNALAWDVILLDLKTNTERLIAKNGNVPTWSEDGHKIRFQRNGNQFVEYSLITGKEKVLMESGKNIPIPPTVILETPMWSDRRNAMSVTLRGEIRGTFIIEPGGKMRQIGDGCELFWNPDSSYLYYVDHGGRMENAFYKVDPETLQRTMWFDSPGDYSHEYFPKVANTGDILVFGASAGGHEHDREDYEIFLWKIGTPPETAVRLTYHTGNDNWPDLYLTD
jgi:hypothetical protein